jgi:hypothetical protein
MWLVQEGEEEGEGSGMLLASGAVPIDTRQLYIVVRWSRNQREPLHKPKKKIAPQEMPQWVGAAVRERAVQASENEAAE